MQMSPKRGTSADHWLERETLIYFSLKLLRILTSPSVLDTRNDREEPLCL